jgi:hypothetical protein
MMGGICLGAALPVFLTDGNPGDRIWLSFVLLITLFLGQFTVVNNIHTARVQLFYDQVNNQMVKFLSRLPKDSTIYFNTPSIEYVVEAGLHLQVFRDRQDLTVDYYRYPLPAAGLDHFFVVEPVMLNAPLPSVRNSLHESGVLTWQQCLQTTLNPRLHAPIFEGVETLRWTDFGLNRLLRLVGLEDKYSFTVKNRPFLITKEMTYGWRVYEIEVDLQRVAHSGGYDGAGGWILRNSQGERRISQFGNPGDLPLNGDVNGDRQTDLILYQPLEHRFLVDLNFDGESDLNLNSQSMRAGDIPLFGDWNGDGVDTLGYFRFSDSSWHYSNDLLAAREETPLVIPTSPDIVPLAGDWDGNGDDTFGFYFPSTGDVYLIDSMDRSANFVWAYRGEAFSVPVAADWYGFGRDTLAIVKDGQAMIRPNNAHCDFPNPIAPIDFGNAGDFPLGGRW